MSEQDKTLAVAQAKKPSALVAMANRINVEPEKLLSTLKETVFKGASDAELLALTVVANEYGLNPFIKEIYAFPAKGGGIVPVVSVDGWTKIINTHPQMDGLEFEWEHEGDKLVSCTSVIHRKDRTRPIRVTEYLVECRRNTDPWKMEHRMLRHKALIQGARVAFGFGGIVDEDEGEVIKMADAHVVETATRPNLDPAPKRERERRAAATKAETPAEPAVDTNPEPEITDLPEPPDTPQNRLHLACADCSITEKSLMAFFRRTGFADAQLVSQLTDEEAEKAIADFAAIQGALAD